jgi:O-antigen/teichoic acid export membrane protein
VARNVAWNWLGICAEILVGLYTVSLLLAYLGLEHYGLWILIGSVTGYFGFLDFGIRASVGRYIAFHRGQGDYLAVSRVLNSALAILTVAASLAILAAVIIVPLLPILIAVPPAELRTAQLAFAIASLALALSLVFSTFDAALWACQRFDLLNAIDVSNTFVRLALSVCLLRGGLGIVGLALTTLIATLLAAIAKGLLSRREMPDLRFGPTFISMASSKVLVGYGSQVFGKNIIQVGKRAVLPLLLGGLFGLTSVALFSIAVRMIGHASMAIAAAAGVVTPVVAALDAKEGNSGRQRQLFIEGGTYCLILAIVCCALFLLLGQPLILLWLGPELNGVAELLAILAIGELLPMSQLVTESILLGSARTRILFVLALGEITTALLSIGLLSYAFGLAAVCMALAAAACVYRGVLPLVYVCRVQRVAWAEHARRVVVPAVLVCAIPTFCLMASVHYREPSTWLQLFVYGGLYTSGCALGALALMRREWLIQRLRIEAV